MDRGNKLYTIYWFWHSKISVEEWIVSVELFPLFVLLFESLNSNLHDTKDREADILFTDFNTDFAVLNSGY